MRSTRPLARSTFWWSLGAISVGALTLRLVYAFRVPGRLGGDAAFYHGLGNLLARGQGYIDPVPFRVTGDVAATAYRLPLFPGMLAVLSKLGADSIQAHRVLTCLIGTGTVVLLGILGRRVISSRGGLLVAGLAAVYPNLWIPDGLLIVETLYACLVALFLVVCYRWIDRPSVGRSLVLGAAVGLAGLARPEAPFLLVVVVFPLVLMHRSLSPRRRFELVGITTVAVLVVLTPWIAFNVGRFERPLVYSTSNAIGFENCDSTYSGSHVGYWDLACNTRFGSSGDEAQRTYEDNRAGLEYARAHLDQLPRVAVFRIARVWDLYRPDQNLSNSVVIDGRDPDIGQWGQYLYFCLIPLAVVGAWILRSRRVPIYPLAAMVVVVTIVAAMTHGEIRFRLTAEVAMLVLGGAGLTKFLGWFDSGPAQAARSMTSGMQAVGSSSAGSDDEHLFP